MEHRGEEQVDVCIRNYIFMTDVLGVALWLSNGVFKALHAPSWVKAHPLRANSVRNSVGRSRDSEKE